MQRSECFFSDLKEKSKLGIRHPLRRRQKFARPLDKGRKFSYTNLQRKQRQRWEGVRGTAGCREGTAGESLPGAARPKSTVGRAGVPPLREKSAGRSGPNSGGTAELVFRPESLRGDQGVFCVSCPEKRR